MKVKSSKFNVIMLCLTFYEATILPHNVFIGFKYAVLLWIFIQYYGLVRKIADILVIAGLYGAITLLSTASNQMPINTIIASFVFGLQIVDIYLVTIHFISKYSLQKYAKIILSVFLILIIFNDLLMLVMKYDFTDPGESYLLGNKFVVSYVHCFASAMAFICAQTYKRASIGIKRGVIGIKGTLGQSLAVLITIYSILICLKVTCSTGAIACIVMLIMIYVPDRIKLLLSNGKVMIIGMAVLNILVLGSYAFLSLPFFENLIYNILGKSFTWTGRLVIWAKIYELIKEAPLIGYGYYNSVVSGVVGFGNPQNGVLKLLIDVGCIGLILYTLLVWKSFQNPHGRNLGTSYPLVAFFYAMLVASIVEINLSHMIVFLTMAMYYVEMNRKLERNENSENRNIINAAH